MTGISDRMGANSKPKNTPRLPTKPKKVSGPKTNPKKCHAEFPSKFVGIYSQTRFASMIYTVITITNLQIVLNTRKNPYYKSSHPQKILAKFSYPPKIPESKLSNLQNPPIIPVT